MRTSDEDDSLADTPPATKPFRLYTAASVGPAIRHYREAAGLTQEQLAEMAGLNRSYLSELEQGRETEQMRRIIRLLKLLGVRATLQKADW
ncbi:MAG TPA: helix-turn-helix transcriptional regulator [Solirubrobacteraceae bacterium]|jgi:transcriptional regulator with XRE-family HTH domain|nr:helix-turn-helix transcriptional regulator [Solirubrobacteraceae bacterium]